MNAIKKSLGIIALTFCLLSFSLVACEDDASQPDRTNIYMLGAVDQDNGIKTALGHSSTSEITITSEIYRAGTGLESVEINFDLNIDSLNKRIKSAKPDLKANVYKYAKLLPAEYYQLPETSTFKKGERRIILELKVDKNALLESWDDATESYILPVRLSGSSIYTINKEYSTVMFVFSRLRAPGVVIKHIPASEKLFAGSPSICIMPNGDYIASHDDNTTVSAINNDVTQIYRSTDKGLTWTHISEIKGQMWSSVFEYQGNLYIHGPDKVAGKLVIRKSTDYGETWTSPINDTNGLLLDKRISGAPTPVVFYNGRVWRAVEDAAFSGNNSDGKWLYQAMMTSAPIGSDLLDASNWTVSNTMQYDAAYLNGKFGGWLEGNAVFTPDGKMNDIIRVDVPIGHQQYAASISISDDGATATFDSNTGFFKMTGGASKFAIRHDNVSNKYYTLANFDYEGYTSIKPTQVRNTLVLMSSDDTRNWKINRILLRHSDVRNVGFQYVDWQIDDTDIVFVSRTSYPDEFGGAMNYHNANYLTFHRIAKFRDTKEIDLDRDTI